MRCLLLLWLSSASWADELDAFNHAFADATRRMDNAATAALWEEDGVSLLPSTKPITGKKLIVKFIEEVMASLPGAKMKSFDMSCFDQQLSGTLASEWCLEHQVVEVPGKPTFDSWGKLLLVLHRGADGKWRLRQEMWNQAVK